jgi:drug/metabolite transporter (DMT)-like permease
MLSLREIGSIRTGTIFSTGSLFGALFAFIILQETFTLVQFLAGLAMTVGVYLFYRKCFGCHKNIESYQVTTEWIECRSFELPR